MKEHKAILVNNQPESKVEGRCLQEEFPNLELNLVSCKCDIYKGPDTKCEDPLCQGRELMDPPCTYYRVEEKNTGYLVSSREQSPLKEVAIMEAYINIQSHGGEEAALKRIGEIRRLAN